MCEHIWAACLRMHQTTGKRTIWQPLSFRFFFLHDTKNHISFVVYDFFFSFIFEHELILHFIWRMEIHKHKRYRRKNLTYFFVNLKKKRDFMQFCFWGKISPIDVKHLRQILDVLYFQPVSRPNPKHFRKKGTHYTRTFFHFILMESYFRNILHTLFLFATLFSNPHYEFDDLWPNRPFKSISFFSL